MGPMEPKEVLMEASKSVGVVRLTGTRKCLWRIAFVVKEPVDGTQKGVTMVMNIVFKIPQEKV